MRWYVSWVGGLFGVLTGAALLFVPGVEALVLLGPLAAGAVAATDARGDILRPLTKGDGLHDR